MILYNDIYSLKKVSLLNFIVIYIRLWRCAGRFLQHAPTAACAGGKQESEQQTHHLDQFHQVGPSFMTRIYHHGTGSPGSQRGQHCLHLFRFLPGLQLPKVGKAPQAVFLFAFRPQRLKGGKAVAPAFQKLTDPVAVIGELACPPGGADRLAELPAFAQQASCPAGWSF